jgi:hypothetical protein
LPLCNSLFNLTCAVTDKKSNIKDLNSQAVFNCFQL